MKTLKEKFGKFEMNKEQMKMVKGGTEYSCRCNNGQGVWTGNYSSQAQADSRADYHCGAGQGTCNIA